MSEDERQYHTGRYNKLIEDCEREIAATFEEYDHFPDRFQADYVKLATNFWKQEPGSDFWSSVFIMTKFPRPGEAGAEQLQAVIDCLRQAIRARGYHPRIAQGPTFKDWLRSNVEVHLLLCRCGVAILEDRYHPELNPNVALEWGWMLGMGRKVLYLREKQFSKERADWLGRIAHEFDWDQPAAGIEAAIRQELPQR